MNCEEYIAKILKAEGVSWLSCFPSNPIIEAAAKEGIRPIAFRHERGAVMAADGFSRVSDGKAFGVVTVAVGRSTGVAQAGGDAVDAEQDHAAQRLGLVGVVGVAQPAQQRHLDVVHRVHIWVAQPDRLLQPLLVVQ